MAQRTRIPDKVRNDVKGGAGITREGGSLDGLFSEEGRTVRDGRWGVTGGRFFASLKNDSGLVQAARGDEIGRCGVAVAGGVSPLQERCDCVLRVAPRPLYLGEIGGEVRSVLPVLRLGYAGVAPPFTWVPDRSRG